MTDIFKNTRQLIFVKILVLAMLFVAVLPVLTARASVNAEFSLSPSSSSVTTGQDTTVTLNLNTGGNSVNSWKATINYSTSAFSSVSVATASGSVFTSVQKPDVTSGGTIRISRYSTTASSASGAVAVITLRASAVGATSLSFAHICNPTSDSTPCSAVTDASGTNLLSGLNNASVTVSAVPVSGSTSTTKTTTKKKGVAGAVAGAVAAVTSIASTDTNKNTDGKSENNAIVRVKVVDKNKKPIENAVVNLNGQQATTNSNGEALFTELPTGKLKGTITHKGKTQQFGIDVISGSSFDKPQSATITFTAGSSSSWGKYLLLAVLLGAATAGIFLFLRKRDQDKTVSLGGSDPDTKPIKPTPVKEVAAEKVSAPTPTEEKPAKDKSGGGKDKSSDSKDKTIKRNDPLKPGVVVRPSDGI